MSEGRVYVRTNREEVLRWVPRLAPDWQAIRAKFAMREVDRRSGTGEEHLLSLSKERGIVPRSDYGDPAGRADSLEDFKLVQPGQIVMNKMQAWNGTFALSHRFGLVSPEYTVLEVLPEFDARFLCYELRSDLYVGQFTWRSRGMGTAFLRLHPENLLDTPLLLPSHSEQTRIADYLDAETARTDALIRKKQRMVGLLEERWKDVMHDGVAGALTSRDETRSATIPWLTELPAGWIVAKVNKVARLGSGHTPSRQHPEWWENRTIPWITTGEVAQMRSDRIEYLSETREMISELGLLNSSAELHPAGTVVLCRTASAGYSAIMGRDMATSQDFATWTCGPLLRPRFLLLCLRVMRQDLLGRLAMGSTHQTIYMPEIESIRVPLPPVSEQDDIVTAVYSALPAISSALDGLTHQIDLLSEHRQALITAAVTGQLDIPEVAA